METSCRFCGKSFAPRSTGGHTQVYCSAACRHDSWDVRHGRTSLASLAAEALPNRGDGRVATCERCGVEFVTRLRPGGRRQRFCLERCARQTYNERNGQRARAHLLRRYGLTDAEYDGIWEDQGGVCAICGQPPTNNLLAVDHDHVTGRVRGLLCAPCNRHLGWYDMYKQQVAGYLASGRDGFSLERSINRHE
jgi:Recombination endonuclease VII